MKRRYVVTQTRNISDVYRLAMDLRDKGYIADWGFCEQYYVCTGIRWWMGIK